jgi:replication factor A1
VSSTHIEVNPDIREAKELRAWYDNTGGNVQIYFLSKGSSMSGGGGEGGFKAAKSSTQRKTIAEVKEAVVSGEKASFFETKASIMIIKSDKDMWYLACPGENCSKKVTSNGAGEFTCDKCMTNYPSCKVR